MGDVAMYVAIALVGVGFLNVLLRYVGQAIGTRLTSNMVIELQWYMFSVVFLMSTGYILRHGVNVRVDFWFAEQPKKMKAWIDFIGHIFGLLPFTLLGLWITWNPVMQSWGRKADGTFDFSRIEQSPDPSGLMRAPIKSMVIVGFVLLLLQGMAEMIKLAAILTGHEEFTNVEELDAPIRIE